MKHIVAPHLHVILLHPSSFSNCNLHLGHSRIMTADNFSSLKRAFTILLICDYHPNRQGTCKRFLVASCPSVILSSSHVAFSCSSDHSLPQIRHTAFLHWGQFHIWYSSSTMAANSQNLQLKNTKNVIFCL